MTEPLSTIAEVARRLVQAWQRGEHASIDELVALVGERDREACQAVLQALAAQLHDGDTDAESAWTLTRTLALHGAPTPADVDDRSALAEPNAAAKTSGTFVPVDADQNQGGKSAESFAEATIDLHGEDRAVVGSPDSRPRIGEYEVLGTIGRGGMGVVYRARQPRADRIVALKVVRADLADDEELAARFMSEAQAAARVVHDHLVTVFEVGESDGRPYFSMQWVDGPSLQERLAQGPLAPRDAARYLSQVCRAVHAAHEAGILHRDIKPANILIDRQTDRALVTDFGLAKLSWQTPGASAPESAGAGEQDQRPGKSHERPRQVFGTPSYMAPEQMSDSHEAGRAADLYSLGATLFHGVAGRPPFRADHLHELLRQVQHDPPPPLRSISPTAPLDLEVLCARCLEKRPESRPATAAELADELDRYLAGEPIRSRHLGRIERLRRWTRRHRWRVAIVVLTLMVLGASGQARRWRQSYLQSRHLQTLSDEIAELVERPVITSAPAVPRLDPTAFARAETLLAELDQLDAEGAVARSSEFEGALIQSIHEALARPGLDATDLGRVDELLEAADRRLGAAAGPLRAELEQRGERWETVFELSGARDVAAHPPDAPARDPDERIPYEPSPDEPLRLRAEFTDWRRAPEVGFILNDDTSVSLREVARRNADAATATRGRRLEVARGGQIVWSASLDDAALPDGPLSFEVVRRGARLDCRVGEQPPWEIDLLLSLSLLDPRLRAREIKVPVEVEEEFPSGLTVVGARDAGLALLRIDTQVAPPPPSPLERGDAELGAGRTQEALLAYREQAESPAADEFRREARFKEALCQWRLGEPRVAEELWGLLATQSGADRWSALAAAQLWVQALRKHRFEEADAALAIAESRLSLEQVVASLPPAIHQELIDALDRDVRGAGYQRFRQRPDLVPRLERNTQLLVLLDAPAASRSAAEYQWVFSLAHAGELDEALRACRERVIEYRLSAEELSWQSLYTWLSVATKQPGLAAPFVEEGLRRKQSEAALQELLLARVRQNVAVGLVPDAASELELQIADWRRRGVARPGEARLLAGFLQESLGNAAGATEHWRLATEELRGSADNIVLRAMVGSLSGSLTDEDCRQLLAGAVSQFQQSPAVAFLARGLTPRVLLEQLPKDQWRNRRGREFARGYALRTLPVAEAVRGPALLIAYSTMRLLVLGADRLDEELPPEVDELVWNWTLDMHAAYVDGRLHELQIVQLVQTFKGVSGVLGWQGLALGLPDSVRAPLAYAFGWHFQRLGLRNEALRLFNEAAEATDDPRLTELARQAVERAREEWARLPSPATRKPPLNTSATRSAAPRDCRISRRARSGSPRGLGGTLVAGAREARRASPDGIGRAPASRRCRRADCTRRTRPVRPV